MNRNNRKPDDPTGPESGAVPPAKPGGGKSEPARTGHVKFDDRGNAIWEWSVTTGAFGKDATSDPLKRLENPTLSIADDAPTPVDTVRANPLGTKKGYDPYDSGKLGKRPERPKRKDLRKLSEWLKLKKQASANVPDKEE